MGSRGPRRPSAGKSPRFTRPGAPRESKGRSGKASYSAVPTGRSAEQRLTEAEPHFLHRPLPQSGEVPGLCSRLQGLRRPAPSATIPQSPWYGGTQEAPPSRRRLGAQVCGGRAPGPRSARARPASCGGPRPARATPPQKRSRRFVPTVSLHLCSKRRWEFGGRNGVGQMQPLHSKPQSPATHCLVVGVSNERQKKE